MRSRIGEMLAGVAGGVTYTVFSDRKCTEPLAVVLPWSDYVELRRGVAVVAEAERQAEQ